MESLFQRSTAIEELSKINFDKKGKKVSWLNNNYPDAAGFIFVYATWCETCHQMSSWYETLGRYWENEFHLGAVNSMDIANKNDELTASWKIEGYPAFYFVDTKGKVSQMKVKLNKDYIYEAMLDKLDSVRSCRGD